MEICSLGQQYIGGLVTGFVFGYITFNLWNIGLDSYEDEETEVEHKDNLIVLRLSDASFKLLSKEIQGETLESIFNQEEEKLNVREVPVKTETIRSDKYVYLDRFGEDKSVDTYTLPRQEERKILRQFNHLINMPLAEAQKEAAKENYSIHILYVGMSDKMPLSSFSSTTLGVRIKDNEWNETASVNAIVTELIDVGGVDVRDVGIIKL